METVIVANSHYWLAYLRRVPQDATLPDADLEGAARALDAAAATPGAWPLLRPLTIALHPYMKRRGPWTGWDGFLDHLRHAAQQHADREAQLTFLTHLGDIQRQYGAHIAALAAYRRAWQLCRRSGERFWEAVTFSNLGDLYRLHGDFWRAEVLCCRACDLFEALGDHARLAYTENHVGLINLQQRRWDATLLHFQRAERLFAQVKDEYGLAMVWRNLSILYSYRQQPREALNYLARALQYYESVKNEYYIANIKMNIGNAYITGGDFERAEEASLQAEAMFMQLADYPNLARARHNLGMIYTQLANWEEAERCFLWAVEQWKGGPDREQDHWNLANTMGELAGMYIAWGQRQKAHHYLAAVAQCIADRTDPAYQGLQRELAERREKLATLAADEYERSQRWQRT